MAQFINQFLIKENSAFKVKDHDPEFDADYKKVEASDILKGLKDEMRGLHEKLYAVNKHSLLIIFQAMDAAGKDSAIKQTISGLNPQGCQVFSFKQPSSEELDHDFLWRHYKALPERGRIGIHNRSHYENVLICKVHPEFVLKENIAGLEKTQDITEEFWEKRYESIRNFEKHLADNGTAIIKIFLNVSKEEQKKRFLERIDQPEKHWKFSSADIDERALWDDYMNAYEEAINATSRSYAPWYVVPADKKWFTRIAISTIINESLLNMSLKIPAPNPAELKKLKGYRKRLLDEGNTSQV